MKHVYKARLCIKGYLQLFGLHYEQTFSPTVRFSSIRALISYFGVRGFFIYHIDFKEAFLNSDLDVIIYMMQPEGLKDSRYPNRVWQLLKTLYGLKQSPRYWFMHLVAYFEKLGFRQSKADLCIFTKTIKGYLILIAIFVDDILLFCLNESIILAVITELQQHYQVTNLGPISWFLGIKFDYAQRQREISLSQSTYAQSLLLLISFIK